MKVKHFISIMLATFLFLTGCQWGNNDMNRDGRAPIDETGTTRDGRNMNNDFTQNVENRNRFSTNDRESNRAHNRFDVSDEAAERIVNEINEIHQAYVVTTKNNAYVAATLDEDSTAKRNRPTKRERSGRDISDDT